MEIRNHLLICHKKKKRIKSPKRRKTRLELSSKPPMKSMSADEEKEILNLIRTRLHGWDKGWTATDIVGINSLDETLVFLVKWTNGEQTVVLSDVAKHKCPQLVIKFYERHSVWDDTDDEEKQ
ncbi:unnamed protein product [Oppiella nova]|uniref:Chromo shadow domain-containing protein n=1 Tax=Oppiella nova TaxID=334625 RepID=A0A7R9QP22_9ACAR|nr:unnamed protein product [Oppiella nova]CAG2169787.1 unnamed protein product [Oppiella nova]